MLRKNKNLMINSYQVLLVLFLFFSPFTNFKLLGFRLYEMLSLIMIVFFLLLLPKIKKEIFYDKKIYLASFFLLFANVLSYFVSFIIPVDKNIDFSGFMDSPNFIGLVSIMRWGINVFIVIIFATFAKDKFFLKFLKTILFVGFFVSICSLLLLLNFLFFRINFSFPFIRNTGIYFDKVPKLLGFAFEPLGFGHYLLSVLPLAYIFLISKKKLTFWLNKYLMFFPMFLAFIFTFSTGAWISLMMAVLVLFFYRPKKFILKSTFFIIICFTVILLVAPNISNIFYFWSLGKVQLLFNSQYLERIWANQTMINQFLNYPVFGVGVGRLTYFWNEFKPVSSTIGISTTRWFGNNDFLQILAETGIIGFIAFICFELSIWAYVFKNYNSLKQTLFEPFVFALIISRLAMFFQLFSGYLVFMPYIYSSAGILLGILNYSRNNHSIINKGDICKE